MEYIYIDEKGPQETFRITEPFDKENKLAYGTDNMHTFVANAVKIPEHLIIDLKREYQIIEKEYLGTRQFKEGTELKGSMLLRKNFEFGVASLKKNESFFYSRLFYILNEYNIDNLLFSISKMSLVINSRLREWILDTSSKFNVSGMLLKYILTKYATVEASENVVNALFDKKHTDINRLLNIIKKDMKNIIFENKENSRMKNQLKSYQQIIYIINKTKDWKNLEPDIEANFNWDKVIFKMELWLLENKQTNNTTPKNIKLILDQGIPKEPFEELEFNSILEDAKSEKEFGIRISDVLVAISGSYISVLSSDVKYDFNNPSKTKRLNPSFFKLDNLQFKLINQMKDFFLKENKTYVYGVDTYFDDGVLFESFLRYISEYESFEQYNSIKIEEHIEKHWLQLSTMMGERYQLMQELESLAKGTYGSLKSAIEMGILHPL